MDAMNNAYLGANAIAIALALASGVLYAQEPAYVTDVSFNHATSQVDVELSLTIPKAVVENNQVTLFLNGSFDVASVEGETLAGHSSEASAQIPPWNEHVLEFESGYDTHRVSFSYSGELNVDDGHGNEVSDERIHLTIDSAWHPIFANFATPMQGTVTIQLDDSWRVYAPGSTTRAENWVLLESASPQLDVAFFATRNDNAVEENGFTVIYDDANTQLATELSSVGATCLASLNEKFGQNRPLDSASLVLLQRQGPSFARANFLSINSNNVQRPPFGYQLVCHELAHNWTAIGNVMSHDYWIPESFAELVGAREIQSQFGDDAFQSLKQSWQERADGTEFVWRENVHQRASHRVNYGLGPLKLLQLENRVGAQTFDQFIADYMTSDITETIDLLDLLTSLTNSETAAWFEDQLATGELNE
ncbi:hypothetical protein CWE12_02270 [Aliidiomarina sedimenti]|uniref:Peptidase M1 membrane alanine aminopeptidase domain-containing protein n=2 Tax=Aliidiomarina sedimenti TaxID=1933879 RepID=A0ABY0C2H4_9GAMM|nr:hypothetical protein CWE12_02270 [Aliidiomarina sedimenti]